jgi:hypothetical protein
MNQNYLSEDQRTPEWYAARSGKFTGSRLNDMLKRKESTEFEAQAKGYKDLIYQIVLERLTGTHADNSMDSASLRWGRDYEPEAKMYYMLQEDVDVIDVGFLAHPVFSFLGVSPDGVIEPRNGIEIKCPKSPYVQMQRFVSGIDDEYYPQVMGCIWVRDAEWWDFVSYDPRMPAHMTMFKQRIYRDEEYIKHMEAVALRAESDVRKLMTQFSPECIAEVLAKFNQPREVIEL